MAGVAMRYPSLGFPEKRKVEQVAVDDEIKRPKQPKRPGEEEFDEHAAGTVNSTFSNKQRPVVDDSSPLVLQLNEDESGIGNNTLQNKEPPMVDDGSTNGSTLVVQQNEDTGGSAKEDSVVEEVSAPDGGYNSSDIEGYNCGPNDNHIYANCMNCVEDEVCKTCGHINGLPEHVYREELDDF